MKSFDRDAVIDRLRAAGCVFAEDEADLLLNAAHDQVRLAEMVQARASGRPLEYVLGWAEFAGLRIAIEPGVFVPRRRSEFLIDCAVAAAPPHPVVVDLCCGSGALGLALRHRVPAAELYAADIDPLAVRCARTNLGEPGRVFAGDLFAALPERLRGRIDLLLANVPYVPADDIALMPPEARDHEPRRALDGGGDGLDVLRRVCAEAGNWLAPGGILFTETGAAQASLAEDVLRAAGLHPSTAAAAEFYATVVSGRRPDQSR